MAEPAYAAPDPSAEDAAEAERLAALRRYAILDTPAEAAFDDVARLAAQVCDVPISLVSLVDEDRQWFKAAVGTEMRETPLDVSFCAQVFREPDMSVVPDATLDPRFATNPLVTGPPGLRFYAGVPLRTPEGLPMGTMCVLDTRPRTLTEAQGFALRTLAAQVMAQLELRRALAERETALAQARASEARFRGMAEDAPFVVWVTDADDRCTYLNRAWYALTGRAPAQSLAFGWLEAVHPEDAASVGETFAQASAGRVPFRTDYRLRRADGAWRWVIDAGTPLTGPDGSFGGYVGSVVDVTERREAEDALRRLTAGLERAVADRTAELEQERARLHAVLSNMPVAVVIVSATGGGALGGGLDYANTAARRLAGGGSAGADCAPLARAAEGADGPGALRPDGTAFAPGGHPVARTLRSGGTVGPEDVLFRRADGGTALLSVRCAPVRDAEGAVAQAVLVLEDVSSRRRAEEALRQSLKMEAVGQLTGGIAHDFNNLLTGIVGSLELMRRRIESGRGGEIGRYVQGAVQSAERAATLTHRLLAFARRQPLDPRPVDVNALVLAMEDLLRRTAGGAVALELRLQPGLWWTLCDSNQLEGALLHLVLNARDAMPRGGRLIVETANRPGAGEDAETVALRVSDTGAGMSPEVAARAFDPFFTTKPAGQGTGLSLSMIYGFARQSGGQVRLRSAPGQGTTVELELPRHFRAAAGLDGAASADPSAAGRRDGGERTVLVVEDQAVVRAVVVEVLRELGYRALEAADGPEGLAVLGTGVRVDLLVTDVGLPGGLNGRQMAEKARAGRPGLKVLFITGYAGNSFGSDALEPGMALLTKPFSVDVLAQRLRGMVESA